MKYALITPARNEEAVIEQTLKSVVAQTQPPERWVVVDDGSTDHTAEIVTRYAAEYPWIKLVQRPPRTNRSFAGKAHAVNSAFEHLKDVDFGVVGNLDADVSFEPDYMAYLMAKFDAEPRLGVAGTPFTQQDYDSARDSFEGENYVAGPCQLFRHTCFQEIGGYVPNHAGGVDWIAVMTARMKGWQVRAFPDKRFHHHRAMGTAEQSPVKAAFSYGKKDYYLGGSPLWQMFRVTFRMAKKPYIAGGLALGIGYFWAAVSRIKRPVSNELMNFHRKEQMKKLRAIFARVLRFKKISAFAPKSESSNQ